MQLIKWLCIFGCNYIHTQRNYSLAHLTARFPAWIWLHVFEVIHIRLVANTDWCMMLYIYSQLFQLSIASYLIVFLLFVSIHIAILLNHKKLLLFKILQQMMCVQDSQLHKLSIHYPYKIEEFNIVGCILFQYVLLYLKWLSTEIPNQVSLN